MVPDRLPVPGDAQARLVEEKRWPYPARSPRDYPYVEGVPECEKCGKQHVTSDGKVSCSAHRKRRDPDVPLEPCRDNPNPGVRACRRHGGANKYAKERTKRYLAEQKAAKSLAKVKVKPIGNPLDHLAELAAESLAAKDHFANVVGELKDQLRFTDDKGAEQLDARVGIYERAMDRAERFLQNLAKIGFEEARLRLEERRADVVREFVIGVLEDLDLRVDDPRVRVVLEEWAPVLDGEPPPHRRRALDAVDVDEVEDEEDGDEDEDEG